MKPSREVRILSSWCATSPEVAQDLFPPLVMAVPEEDDAAWRQLLQSLGALRLNRMLSLVRSRGGPPPLRLDGLDSLAGRIRWNGEFIGTTHALYRTVLPYEAQVRVAYEVFYRGFLDFLSRRLSAVVLAETDTDVELFVPASRQFSLAETWTQYVDAQFSTDALHRTLGLMLNTSKLVERRQGGFGYIFRSRHGPSDSPVWVPSQDVELFIVALYYAALEEKVLRRYSDPLTKIQDAARKLRHWEEVRQASQSEKQRSQAEQKVRLWADKLQELQGRRAEERERNVRELKTLDDTLAASLSRPRLQLIQRHAERFNRTARAQFGPGIVSAQGLAAEIVRLEARARTFPLPPLLCADWPGTAEVRRGGDDVADVCYACGRAFAPEHMYKASMLVVSSSSQRTQSGARQVEPPICEQCYAVALISPIKMGGSSLVLRLESSADDWGGVEERVRGWVTGQLGLVAGRYLSLKPFETYGEGQERVTLVKQLGRAQYALYRVASEFAPEVFTSLRVTALLGGQEVALQRRHLWWLSVLVQVFGLRRSTWPATSKQDKAQFAAFGRAIRHVQHEEVIAAIYELLSAGLAPLPLDIARASQLERLRAEHVRWLEMDYKTDRAQFFRDVAAMTGLLYAFCSHVRSSARTSNANERIEVRKAIERCDDPYQVNYTVAGSTASVMGMLYRNADMHFTYDETKALLGKLGVNAAERESSTSKGQPALQLFFDDVIKAYTYLFETRYTSTKDQRDFVYALKLSLYARFADLIERPKEEA